MTKLEAGTIWFFYFTAALIAFCGLVLARMYLETEKTFTGVMALSFWAGAFAVILFRLDICEI